MIITGVVTSAQTQVDLSGMTHNISLGQNCSSSQEPELFETIQDVNLNGYTITLRNSILKINGNLNGGGRIEVCGNSNSFICLTGSIQNNIVLQGITIVNCSVLSTDTFEYVNEIPKNLNYAVYNILGKEVSKGNTNSLDLPKNIIFILKVEGYQAKKMYIE